MTNVLHVKPANLVRLQAVGVVVGKADDGSGDLGMPARRYVSRNHKDACMGKTTFIERGRDPDEVFIVLRNDTATFIRRQCQDIYIRCAIPLNFMRTDDIDDGRAHDARDYL
jgi:hypothetical protein